MNVVTFNKQIFRIRKERTWLEIMADSLCNGKPVAPDRFFNSVEDKSGPNGRLVKLTPDSVLRMGRIYTGTFAIVGSLHRRLMEIVKTECIAHGDMKKVTVLIPESMRSLKRNMLVTCDVRPTACAAPPIALLDGSGNQIETMREFRSANKITIEIIGETVSADLGVRQGGTTAKQIGPYWAFANISGDAAAGLLLREYGFGEAGICTLDQPHVYFGSITDLRFATLEPISLEEAVKIQMQKLGKLADRANAVGLLAGIEEQLRTLLR